MRNRTNVVLMLLCFGRAGVGNAQDLVLKCDGSRQEDLALLGQAPLGATRISKHHLRVNWSGGSRDFIDVPPYDEPLDGTRYSYCGYRSALGMHLVYKASSGVSTGVLLEDATGKTTEAGEYVAFSRDKSKYFAAVQPDGLDGQEWYVYWRNGTRIWKGLSGITAVHGRLGYRYFSAVLENPRWNLAGELEATHACEAGRRKPGQRETTVTLTRSKGAWVWLPEVECPKVEP
ncbi:MAG: hypothetical protein ACHQM4_04550 [Thermoanaerobaculia bacterium]